MPKFAPLSTFIKWGGSLFGGRREVLRPKVSAVTSWGVALLVFSSLMNSAHWINLIFSCCKSSSVMLSECEPYALFFVVKKGCFAAEVLNKKVAVLLAQTCLVLNFLWVKMYRLICQLEFGVCFSMSHCSSLVAGFVRKMTTKLGHSRQSLCDVEKFTEFIIQSHFQS